MFSASAIAPWLSSRIMMLEPATSGAMNVDSTAPVNNVSVTLLCTPPQWSTRVHFSASYSPSLQQHIRVSPLSPRPSVYHSPCLHSSHPYKLINRSPTPVHTYSPDPLSLASTTYSSDPLISSAWWRVVGYVRHSTYGAHDVWF